MKSLREAIDEIEEQQKTLEVHSDDDAVAEELTTQFSTRNVQVIHFRLPERDGPGFIIIRNPDGEFVGALSIEHLRTILSPEIHPPWKLEDSGVSPTRLFDFLDNTVFTAYNRRQMLATAREIEERAWRTNSGTLYAGFQNAASFRAQLPVYNRFATERDMSIKILIKGGWTDDEPYPFDIVTDAGGEIGQFWVLVFDGGESELSRCGLIAEERESDHYYGFWTYDPGRVEETISYLESKYVN